VGSSLPVGDGDGRSPCSTIFLLVFKFLILFLFIYF
jgi:hypothetical protein